MNKLDEPQSDDQYNNKLIYAQTELVLRLHNKPELSLIDSNTLLNRLYEIGDKLK